MDQQPPAGVSGPAGRRLHIAHRRSPSEMTPMIVEQLALQQQIEQLQQQQQHIAGIHQQYVNMGMLPPQQQPMQNYQQQLGMQGQASMAGMPPQNAFQFPQQPMQPQNLGVPMNAPMQPGGHRRNHSALPNMNTGPPPAPSSGTAFGDPGQQGLSRDAASLRGGRGGGPPSGPVHARRHSLALPEAKRNAALAQQKTSGFQFPIPGASAVSPNTAERSLSPAAAEDASSGSLQPPQAGNRGLPAHVRSHSMAVGNGRGGSAARPGGFQLADSGNANNQQNDFQRKQSGGHGRTSSRNFDGNWRQQNNQPQLQENQAPQMGSFSQPQNPNAAPFQPGHKARGSISQSIGSMGHFQVNQPQFIQTPQGPVMIPQPQMVPGQQLNPIPIQQLQALQIAGMGPQHFGNQGGLINPPQLSAQQQQRKTLFTPYLPHAGLPALLSNLQLVEGILRVNKKNRSDAYVTTDDLDADIFICGSKDRNRALEGDLVAVELLNVDEVWSQKREKEEKKKRKDISDARSGNTNDAPQGRARSNSATNGDAVQDAGNEGGLRRRGSLRQRPPQKKNDDVEVEGQSLLLMEEEEVNDDQKPLYAGHVVAVIERVSGQMFSGTLGLLRPSSQATKEKQEAERQHRDGPGRHQQDRQQEKPKIVWFKPTDKRVPLIAIPTEQAPKDFVEKHQDYANKIFVASIKRWPITSLHPFGTLVDSLGDMGDLQVETDALLRDNNFGSDEFSEPVLKNIGFDNWSVSTESQEALAQRKDLRGETTFTIDPLGSQELDDALHVKELEDGMVEIGIHVADAAHFIKANSLVDREAKKRGTGVYLVNRTVNMLPPKLANEVCSLSPGEERFTVSVILKVDPKSGQVNEKDIWIGKAIIKSCGKLSYDDVDAVMGGNEVELEGVTARDIQLLKNIAQKFREVRYGNKSQNMPPLRLIHQLDDENVPVEHNIFKSTPAHEIMEELGHKANAIVAEMIIQALPEKALLRSQNPPNFRRLHTFAQRMSRLGYEVDITNSRTLWNSLFNVKDDDLRKGMETLLIKAMRRAKYVVAGKVKPEQLQHYALNLPIYTHFTNPSRRYGDIVVHRQLESALSKGAIGFSEDMESLAKTADSCNNKKDSAQAAQEQSVHIDSCRIMDKKRVELGSDFISEGVVLCVYESAFDVLIPEYGFEKRVHCDQLPLKKAEFRTDDRVLELYWEKGVSSSAYVPEDERSQVRPNLRQRVQADNRASKQASENANAEARRRQVEAGSVPTDDADALFDDDDDVSEITGSTAGVSLGPSQERPTQSMPPSPSHESSDADQTPLRTRSDPKLASNANGTAESQLSNKEKYLSLFKLREEGGEHIQDVTEMTRVPVILKTDLMKSPPCLTIRSVNPFAL